MMSLALISLYGHSCLWNHWYSCFVEPIVLVFCEVTGTPVLWTTGTPVLWSHWYPCFVESLVPLFCGVTGTLVKPLVPLWNHWYPCETTGTPVCETTGTLVKPLVLLFVKPLNPLWNHWYPCFVEPLVPLFCGTIATPVLWNHCYPCFVEPLVAQFCRAIVDTLRGKIGIQTPIACTCILM